MYYEYKTIIVDADEIDARLNHYGAEGWAFKSGVASPVSGLDRILVVLERRRHFPTKEA